MGGWNEVLFSQWTGRQCVCVSLFCLLNIDVSNHKKISETSVISIKDDCTSCTESQCENCISKWNDAIMRRTDGTNIDARWEVIIPSHKYCPPLQKVAILVENDAGEITPVVPNVVYVHTSSSDTYLWHVSINTHVQLSFYPFFILHNITTQYMLFFSVQKLSRSSTPTQAPVHQCQAKSSQGFYVHFFFFYNLPFKKYQFHKRYDKVFVRLLLLVSVCVCLHVKKHLYSSVSKKGYVWNLSPFVCLPPF